MWRELIVDAHPALDALPGADPGPEFFPGAPAAALAEAERALGVAFPESLWGLLTETDGVSVIYGSWLIWPLDEIVRRNLELRGPGFAGTYMPLDHLLFFGDTDGYQFAFGVIQGAVQREQVYLWNPYDDSREWQAPSLRAYIEWSLSGKLKR